MAIVMLVLLATVHSSTSLKAARANAPISLGQTDSDLVLNTKNAPTISLWSWGGDEETESSDDDVEAAEVETAATEGNEVADSSAALLIVVDGSNYAPVWKSIVGRTNRFAVFRRNAANPSKVDVALGSWNSANSDFQAQFQTTGEAVGFYVLGDKSITAVYEVVYLPSTSKLTASQVLANFGLPANPRVLNAPGLPIANTLVVRNVKDITTTNLVMNAKAAGTVSLWWGDEEESESSDDDVEAAEVETVETGEEAGNEVVAGSAALLTVVDGSNYAPVWKTLVGRTNRFAVFRRNAANAQKVDVRLGSWSSLISNFQAQFPTNEEAVGFFILGDKSITALYEVVYLPSTSKLTAAQVLANFGLPTNPKVLNAPGLPIANTLVVRNLKDITTTNFILNAKAAGTVNLLDWGWGDNEETESSDDDVETAATEGNEVADSSAALLAVVDGSAYAPVWKSLVNKSNRFAVFRKNAANPQKVDVRLGSWNSLISDFQAQFPALEGAVGFFILGDGNNIGVYEVVFVPPNNSTTATKTLAAFGLPANPKLLNAPGLPVANTLVVRSLKDISTSNFILNAKTAGTVSLWWGDEEESESSDDDVEAAEVETVETVEEAGVQSLWGWSSSSSSSSIASDGSAYTDVWAALKAKTNRFVVFRQNANNSKLIDVDSGNWNTTFPQFASLFQVNKPQVGYIYLGTRNHEQLYEVVYCPTALRTNPATVMVNFGLPPNPSKLTSFDLPVPYTFVATDKKQIDTGNVIMKAVAGGIIP